MPRACHTLPLFSAVLTLVCFATLSPAQNRFVQVPTYPAGGSLPTLLAQHDVNGDGKLDLIVLNVNTTAKTETVSLLLGTGTGGYEAPKTMGAYPSSYGFPIVGDVNGDGHLDLIFSVSGSSPQTRVYLGSGETFETTAKVSTGVNCLTGLAGVGCEMQLADLNKDGKADLIESGTNGVTIMLGDGNGSFRTPQLMYGPSGSVEGPFAIGDFNNDGIPDIASYDSFSDTDFYIFFGNGDGTFRLGMPLPPYTPGGAFGLPVAADLRGNGDTDLILAITGGGCGSGGFEVLLGNGNGTFASTPATYSTGGFTYDITVADMNGDGKPDIVVANQEGGSYSVLLNLGGGKFAAPMNYMTPQGVAGGYQSFYGPAGNYFVGDLTGNGRLDLSISSQAGVDVLINEGGGKLKAPGVVEVDGWMEADGTPLPAFAVDLNRDGIPDLESNTSPPGNYSCRSYELATIRLSEGGVPFAGNGSFVSEGWSSSIAGGGDFNGDGIPDLLMSDYTGSEQVLSVQFNNGKGAFAPLTAPVEIENGTFAVGDFNRDGLADAAEAAGGQIKIMIGNGKGGFTSGATYSTGEVVPYMAARDVNGDGKIDLIVVDTRNDSVDVLLGNGDGTFQAAKSYSTLHNPTLLDFADFNRDGHVDIVVGSGYLGEQGPGSEVSLLLNNGNGTFKPAVSYPAGGPVSAIAAIDLTGNGNDGVLIADSPDNKVFLLNGNGKGAFAAPVDYYPGGSSPTTLTVADFNQDGAQDVLVGEITTEGYMVLYNTGGTSVTLTSSNKAPKAGQEVTFTVSVSASVVGSGTPTGTVTFKNGSATLGTATLSDGKATFHTTALTKGTHSITADYNGSTSFNPHASAPLEETVE